MTRSDVLHAPRQGALLIRPLRRADRAALRALRPRWRALEHAPFEGGAMGTPVEYVIELGHVLVGEFKATVVDDKALLLGDESALAPQLTSSRAALKRLITATRHDVVRRLGLSQVISDVPLWGYDDHRDIYGVEGFVQQVVAGAIDFPLLSAHLELGARIVDVFDGPTPRARMLWAKK